MTLPATARAAGFPTLQNRYPEDLVTTLLMHSMTAQNISSATAGWPIMAKKQTCL